MIFLLFCLVDKETFFFNVNSWLSFEKCRKNILCVFLSTIGSSMKTFKQESATKYQNSAKYSDTTRYLQHYRILFRVILLQIDLGDMKSYHKIAKKTKQSKLAIRTVSAIFFLLVLRRFSISINPWNSLVSWSFFLLRYQRIVIWIIVG